MAKKKTVETLQETFEQAFQQPEKNLKGGKKWDV